MDDISIKREIENYLKYGAVFDYALKKNPDLYLDKLSSVVYKYYWFEYDEQDIQFTGSSVLNQISNEYGDLFYLYISDFEFNGKLCYSDNNHKEYKNSILIIATIRVFKKPDREIDVTDQTNHIEVWNMNQKQINLFYLQAKQKLSALDLLPYDYENYTKNWSKIDNSESDYLSQSHVTSFYYLQEIIECYERIKHLLSLVLLNFDYSNKYTSKATELPDGYNVSFMYEIEKNFSVYDRLYLLYSELVIESYYKYWERIGFYLFQFLKPILRLKLSYLSDLQQNN